MAFLIDQLNNSGLFAQSAYSAGVATCDSEGNVITATYLTGVDLTPYQTTADMINYQTVSGMSDYATTGELANKLDATAFNIPDSANWNSNYETVQNNSATWNTVTNKLDSTAYTPFDPTYMSGVIDNKLDTTAFSDVSGTFLTSHQSLADYATTAWVDSQGYLTAHQPISADEWNNVYETVNVYSASWTGGESSPTAAVDSNGSIDIVSSNNTVYFDVNGTWFNDAVNSALPTSSTQWNSNYETVNTNSGVWGGSALNISAGEGVKVTLVNNNLVFSTDETVLWEGTLNTLNNNIECSENLSNFNTVKIYYRIVADGIIQSPNVYEFEPSEMSNANNLSFGGFYLISNNYYGWWLGRLVITDGYKVKITNTNNSFGSSANPSPGTNVINETNVGYIYKIVGINRKNNT